jgi:Lamin Tail Domain
LTYGGSIEGRDPKTDRKAKESRRGGMARLGRWFRNLPQVVQLVAGAVTILLGYLTIAGIFGWYPFPSPPDVQIDTASSRFNPSGDDDPAAEYVCLVNQESDAVDLTGWVLRDTEGDVNVLPRFTLAAEATVRVHPGNGRDTRHDLFGENTGYWNNGTDSVTLLTDDGETIDSSSYSSREQADGGDCGP